MENDQWQQQQANDEQRRMSETVAVLSAASTRPLEEVEILFLASELGLSVRDVQLTHKEAA